MQRRDRLQSSSSSGGGERSSRLSETDINERLAREREFVLQRHNVSRETIARLDTYVSLLLQWQPRINLIAPSTIPEIWTRHIEDALGLCEVAIEPLKIVDLGSGGGLPGLVLAIMRTERAGAQVDLVESNSKKSAFLRTVIRELGLPAQVHAERIEDCGKLLADADAISARALASLDDLLAYVGPHAGPKTRCFFPKGRNHEQEIKEASAHWRFAMIKHGSGVEEGSVILEISDIHPSGQAAA